MTDFFQLTPADQLEAINVAADASGIPPHLLEKDIWVVWALQHVFAGPHAAHLVFKGGTSLSKAHNVIRRFSEDVDLTYDIRAIAGDLVGNTDEPLPANRSQEKKWSKAIRMRLADWVSAEIAPGLQQDLLRHDLPATVRVEGDKAFIDYRALTAGTGYVSQAVMLEFGARSTGEPSDRHELRCDAAAYLPAVTFPATHAQVMRPERTFWEKVTAIHVFCLQGAFRGGQRFARHWYDVIRLDSTGFADRAIANRSLALAVAEHKGAFFPEKNTDGSMIDYHAATSGQLRLVPSADALTRLSTDYRHMIDDGLFLDEADPFEALLDRCRELERKINASVASP